MGAQAACLRRYDLKRFMMKNKRFSDAQILSTLRQAENGAPVTELCREHGMSSAALYQWRTIFGGMDAFMLSEMRDMQAELKRLKRMYADLSMQNDLLMEAALGKAVRPSQRHVMAQTAVAAPWCQHCAGVSDVRDQRKLLRL